MKLLLLCWFTGLAIFNTGHSQKFLQLEKYGKAKTQKFYPGDLIEFQLKEGQGWYVGYIEDLLVDQNLIALKDRYVPLPDITKLRFHRKWPRSFRKQLTWFGLGWSAFGLVGTATDGNPETNYRATDAVITGSAMVAGSLLPPLFNEKYVDMGRRRRLRMLDLTITGSSPKAHGR